MRDGTLTLVASAVGLYENSRPADGQRRAWVSEVLALAAASTQVNEQMRDRARDLEQLNVKAMDALHLAAAEHERVDWFITCDDRLMRRYNGPVIVATPSQFVDRRPWDLP